MNAIKVAGFDPSTSNWGIAKATVDLDTLQIVSLDDLILVSTESEKKLGVRKDSDDYRRAIELNRGINDAIQDVSLIITEIPFFNPGGYAAANYNSGLVIGILGSLSKRVIQVFPQDVKMYAVGSRKAEKQEMIDWAVGQYPAAPWRTRTLRGKTVLTAANEHLADAVAVINAGLYSDQLQQLGALMSGRAA